MPSPAPPVAPRLQGGAPPALYADKARQGGLVAILSERHVGRLLQSGRAHKSRCGLHAEPDAAAAAQMADLTTRYAQAPAIGNACERVLSTDVMPRHPSPGAPPSRQAHGPWARGATRVRSCLAWHSDVDRQYRRVQGTGGAPSMGPPRLEEDFMPHRARTVPSAHEASGSAWSSTVSISIYLKVWCPGRLGTPGFVPRNCSRWPGKVSTFAE